jgi:hypothetical protein
VIVGQDGAVGFPAYSGMYPSPMVASALVTSREGTVAGDATWDLYEDAPRVVRPPFLTERQVGKRPSPSRRTETLQPSVRAALIEGELLRATSFWRSGRAAGLIAPGGGPIIVQIGRLKDEVGHSVFDRQLRLVDSYAALRAERSSEILAQVVPQITSWSSIASLSPDAHRYTLELLGIGLRFAMLTVMQFKHEFDVMQIGRASCRERVS